MIHCCVTASRVKWARKSAKPGFNDAVAQGGVGIDGANGGGQGGGVAGGDQHAVYAVLQMGAGAGAVTGDEGATGGPCVEYNGAERLVARGQQADIGGAQQGATVGAPAEEADAADDAGLAGQRFQFGTHRALAGDPEIAIRQVA